WGWVIAEEVVRAVLWFHPGIWWLISRIRLAREEVVDELVVRETGRRRSYVRALLAFSDETPLAPAAAFAHRRHLFDRIMRLSKLDMPSQPIKLQFQKASIGAILEFLGKIGGIRMEIGAGVNDAVAPLNIKFTNAKFSDVLSLVVTATASKLNYTVVDSKTLR